VLDLSDSLRIVRCTIFKGSAIACHLHPSSQKHIYIGYTCVYFVVHGTCTRLRETNREEGLQSDIAQSQHWLPAAD